MQLLESHVDVSVGLDSTLQQHRVGYMCDCIEALN